MQCILSTQFIRYKRKIKALICIYRYIFLEYASPNQALEAVKNADGYKLDKQHTFRVNLFTDFDKYVSIRYLKMYGFMLNINAIYIENECICV